MADEKLIRRRASYKGRVTAFSNYLNTLDVAALSPPQANELQLRIGKIRDLYQQYDDVQLQLECAAENIDSQIEERNEFESIYYQTLSRAQNILISYGKSREQVENESSTRTRKSGLVKLPTIQLPQFDGSYNNWLEFHDTFTSLIHLNGDIDEINKFHYLRACLEGSAAVVIQSIEFSANNYAVAWKLLCERFDNKRLLIQNHVSALFNIEPITKESSAQLKRIIDQLNKNLRSLESLGEPTKHWDTLLIHIITHKFDSKTYREWEDLKSRIDKNTNINLETFINFMRSRADFIETLELSRNVTSHQTTSSSKPSNKIRTLMSVPNSNNIATISPLKSCPKCSGDHKLNNCPSFLALSINERLEMLPSLKICYNCFNSGHFANRCKKTGCKICQRKHNTLIHAVEFKSKQVGIGTNSCTRTSSSSCSGGEPESSAPVNRFSAPIESVSKPNVTLTVSVTNADSRVRRDVLLSTALVKLYDDNNVEHIARAVLDSGSTSCLMTESLSSKLNLPIKNVDKSILGINNISSHVGKMCRVPMKSLNEDFSLHLQCFVLPSITECVPNHQIDLSSLNIPSNICLADPNFHSPANVDLIIGADVFWDLLGTQRIKLGDGQPILYETRLGWLVSGPINSGYIFRPSRSILCNFTKVKQINQSDGLVDLNNQLIRFWQLEEVCPKLPHYSPEEKLCEEHFVQNTTRLEDGRFCVKIPLKQNPELLGDSYHRAKYCFLSLERRFKNQPVFREMYCAFMSEYELLGHMTEVQLPNPNTKTYFIPHHGVLRESSTTTKLRAVFNASSATTSGVDLNSIQMVGPTVQDDLLSILLRFRQFKYILAADVEKMYRQILVHPDDRYLQLILWRDDPSKPLKVYQLNTVTYGTASAPFLATRCLKQIGLECDNEKVSEVIKHDFYVDDLLTGEDTIEEAYIMRQRVTEALASARMPLRKWKSNEPLLLTDMSGSSFDLNIGASEPCKTLGLGWQSNSDELYFSIDINIHCENTKRGILSVISQIFDPLGLLAICVILMKMLLQQLWLHKTSWDTQLTPEIASSWANILKSLPDLNKLRIPRIVVCDKYNSLELHIFSDASQCAYGACLYVRSTNDKGDILVRLLIAKSRVAPIKPTTIPRLELCGALVGARLYEKVTKSLRVQVRHVTFWTDSTIVLGWLSMLPSKLQPFVRNRVAEILEKTDSCSWRYVPTDQNPADHISRGVNASLIQSLDLWWTGPEFLKQDSSAWPRHPVTPDNLPEIRPDVVLIGTAKNNSLIDFERFSNLLRLKRTVAYMLRFINLCKKKSMATSYLSDEELQNALKLIIRISQNESFPEYRLLLNKENLPKKSSLLKFNVFLDKDNLMRVGGRLGNSDFSLEKKHPILIQSNHRFSKLLFLYEHKNLMHAGPQLLLASIRETYWPVRGRNLAKACYRNCLLCSRMRGKIVSPIMGNLPRQRLSLGGYPFENVGVDYAGPISSASRQGRGCRLVKVYIVIFVCFTTKAIHLELVGDLSSNNFLSALRRFMSRRGKPVSIHSDNGTSFVGAYNELAKFLKANCDSLSEALSSESVAFHFIPAYSPHFGGLWEAGVKSTKHHLVRVLGNSKLTFEELYTVLVQIEAILNSRPLTPLSSDPEDLTPLTPGHFLIGRPLTSLPVSNHQDSSYNYLTRYQRIEQLRQHFWTRWSKEYVAELQQRTKWQSGASPLEQDALVLLKEDNLPPLKWKLGRIVALYPGSDGITRVADVKTANGLVRRAFSKICPLPKADVVG